jgi:hypothetical protein
MSGLATGNLSGCNPCILGHPLTLCTPAYGTARSIPASDPKKSRTENGQATRMVIDELKDDDDDDLFIK